MVFDTGTLTGSTDLTVTGLSDTDLWLFDVTDPESPVNCLLTPALFTDVGDSYAMTFRETLSSKKSYVLTHESRLIDVPVEDVDLDDNSAIIGDAAESGVDVLVISHGDFKDLMGEWVSYRRAQGYRVLMVG